jgi:hypothetical protein
MLLYCDFLTTKGIKPPPDVGEGQRPEEGDDDLGTSKGIAQDPGHV